MVTPPPARPTTAGPGRPPGQDGPPGVHVVVGAGGAVGRLVVGRLAAAGCRVRAVTRDGRDVGARGVELAAADARDAEALTAACRGAAAVYHCVMPPLASWTEGFPVVTDALVDAASAVGARLVYADDTWMYGRVTGPMTEDTPERPVGSLGVLRAWIAERLLHAAAQGRLPVSIARAGELYGPGVRSLIAGNVFGAAARGRTVHWIGDPDLPLTPTFVGDFATTLAVLGTTDTADAGVWHVPHPGQTTGRGLAAEACRQAGTRLRLMAHGSAQVRALGAVLPLARLGAGMAYQFEQPFEVDGSRAAEAFGLTPTPYGEGVAAALAAQREPGPVSLRGIPRPRAVPFLRRPAPGR